MRITGEGVARIRQSRLTAASTGFLVLAGTAWILWQWLQGERHTLTKSEFQVWLRGLVVVATAMGVAGALLWRGSAVRVALALGSGLAVLCIGVGLVVDILTSIS